MVFDLFTLGGFFLFLFVLAALWASHDFRHDASAQPLSRTGQRPPRRADRSHRTAT
jgi:hypothetical protein